jgi:hypothetical protein
LAEGLVSQGLGKRNLLDAATVSHELVWQALSSVTDMQAGEKLELTTALMKTRATVEVEARIASRGL